MTRTSTPRMESTKKKSKSNRTKIELKKLKSILPRIQEKPSSTPIEIVLETIRYIRQLEDQLIDRYHTVPFTNRTSLSDMSMDLSSSFLQDISNTD